MKKFTKLIIAILAVAIILASFVSCGLVEDTDVVEKVKIQKETVLTVDGDIEVSGAYYGWYFSNAYNTAYGEASQAAEESVDSSADSAASPEIKVDMAKVKKDAIDDIIAVKMACKKAGEAGIKLTAKDVSNVESQVNEYKTQLISQAAQQGMNIAYNDYLRAMNTNADAVKEAFEDEYLASLYYASFVADEYVTAKHILIKYGDDTRTKDEAKALANDIIAKIKDGEDFDKLMEEHSDDGRDASGKLAAPDGYTFTKDSSYMQAFKDAAFSLKENEVSGLVNVEDYYSGYHIIKRVPVTNSAVANALENNDKIDAEREKLVKDVKYTESKKISYYDNAFNKK